MGEIVLLLLVSSLVLVISLALKAFYGFWLKPMKLQRHLREQGIRGDPYKFLEQGIRGDPYKFLYGNLKENIAATKKAQSKSMELSHRIVPRVLPFINQTVQKYGKLSVTWNGPTPCVQVLDLDLARDILSNKSGHFFKSRVPLGKVLITGLVSYEGEKSVKHRRIINPAFHLEKLKMMLPAIYTSCNEMVGKWQKLISKESTEIDVWPELQNLTGDVISRAAFGSSYEEGRHIFKLQTEQAKLVTKAIQSGVFPGSSFLPTKTNRRMKEIYREVKTLLFDIIHKREKLMKTGEANTDDLLGLLMESNFKEITNNTSSKNVGMTIDEVIEECKLFYFAGQETAATLLVWTMIVLSMHPEWQAQARDEVLKVFGERKPDFDRLNHLKVVTMILYEVLRLYSSAIFLKRVTNKATKLGEVYLPPGVEVLIPTLLIHHDHELWGDDAEEFNPNRFSDGVSNATKNQMAYHPFGWGPRMCIGQNFAMIEAKLALVMILQRFSFELSTTYVHAPWTLITLQPQYGAQVILHKL